MNRYRFNFFLILLLCIAQVSGYLTQNAFSDSSTSFTTTQNITKYVVLPNNAYILNASVSINGYSTYNLTLNSTNSVTYKSRTTPTVGYYTLNGQEEYFTFPKSSLPGYSIWYYDYGTTYTGIRNYNFDIYCNTSTTTYQYYGSTSFTSYGTFTGYRLFYDDDDCLTKDTIQLKIVRTLGVDDAWLGHTQNILTNFTYTNQTQSYPNNFTIGLFLNNTQIYNKTIVNGTTNNIDLNVSLLQNYVYENGTVPISFNFINSYGVLEVFNLSVDFQSQLEVTMYDENTDTLIQKNTTLEIIGDSGSYIKNITFNASYAFSDLPRDTYELRYFINDYRTRSYFVNIGFSTQELDLFDIETNTSSLILVNIKDERGVPVTGHIVKMLRSFINRDAVYLPVEMSKTDSDGNAGFYVDQYTTFYQFIVLDSDDTTILYTTLPTKITGDVVFLTVNRYGDAYAPISNIITATSSLTYNNNTQILTYVWNDESGDFDYSCLNVTEWQGYQGVMVSGICSESASGTMVLNLSTIIKNETRYTGTGIMKVGNLYQTSVWEYYNSASLAEFGKTGLFFSFIFIITMLFLGMMISFPVGIFMALLTMFVTQWIGITFFSTGLIVMFGVIALIISKTGRQ